MEDKAVFVQNQCMLVESAFRGGMGMTESEMANA
jgi:hypothetical protein